MNEGKLKFGIDITKNHISFVLLDLIGNIVSKERKREKYEDSIKYYKNLGESIDKFIFESHVDKNKILEFLEVNFLVIKYVIKEIKGEKDVES